MENMTVEKMVTDETTTNENVEVAQTVTEEKQVEVTNETTTNEEVSNAEEEVKDEEKAQMVFELDQLKTELEKAKATITELLTTTNEVETLKNTTQSQTDKISSYEKMLGDIVEVKMKNVPEQLVTLMPQTDDVVTKLDWLNKAEQSGLFNQEQKALDVEIGKPMNPTTPKADTTNLSAMEIMKMAYGTLKK